MTTIFLPSIRSFVGDQFYYVTTLSFDELAGFAPEDTDLIGGEEDIKAGASYVILANPKRPIGQIIVGVSGGSPNWTPLRVNTPDYDGITEGQKDRIEGRFGLLSFDGSEQFFVIEGRYKIAGIKFALESKPELKDSCVSVIFVSHECENDKNRTKNRRQR